MGMAVVTLKKGEGRLLKSGGMWIFDNEIDTVMGNFENGDIVLVHDFDGYPMGRGFINTNSKITVRLMTRDENVDINEELLEKRVRDAWEYLEDVKRVVEEFMKERGLKLSEEKTATTNINDGLTFWEESGRYRMLSSDFCRGRFPSGNCGG